MAFFVQSDVQRGVETQSPESFRTLTCTAVEKFGQAAVERQRALVKSAALQCLENKTILEHQMTQTLTPISEGGWIFLQKIPSESISLQRGIPKVTCADPSCPTFERAFQADEGRISIEPSSNIYIKHIPHLPLADLAATCATPLLGEANIRGKGENHCLWMHVICAENMDLLQIKHTSRVRVERRVSTVPGLNYQLDSLQRYSILKWLAVIQGEKTLNGIEGRDFWRKDDGLAVYLSKEQYDHIGWWKNVRIDVSAKEVRHQLMSAVLGYTQVLKERVSRLGVESNRTIRLPKATTTKHSAAMAMRKARKRIGEPETETELLDEFQEEDNGYAADVDDSEDPVAARASPRHELLPFKALKKVEKGVTTWHLKRPNPNLDTPMVRFLLSDPEDVSRHPEPPAQEAPLEDVQEDLLEDDDTSSEDAQSLDSWSDPDKTIATIHRNVGLAQRLF